MLTHLQKFMFYVFLLVALSTATVVSILKFNQTSDLTENQNFYESALSEEDNKTELMTSPLIEDGVTIRVTSGVKSEESAPETTVDDVSLSSSKMEKFDGLISLSSEDAVESASDVDEVYPLTVSDAIDVLGNESSNVEEDLVLDSEILLMNEDEELTDVTDSRLEMSDVSASRVVEVEDFVDDSESVLLDEEELENTFFASSDEDDAILVESNDVALQSESVDGSDEIVFDSNDVEMDDVDVCELGESDMSVFDLGDVDGVELEEKDGVNSEEIGLNSNEAETPKAKQADDVIFDSNDVEMDDVEEGDGAESDEIVFESNDVEIYEVEESNGAESDEIVFDSNDVEIYEVEEGDDADSDEIVFDSNDVEIYEIEECNDADSDEIVFDSNDVEFYEDDSFDGENSLEEMSQSIWGLNTDEDYLTTDALEDDEILSDSNALEEEFEDAADESIATTNVDDEDVALDDLESNDVASTPAEDVSSPVQDIFESLDGMIDEDNLSALPLEEEGEEDSVTQSNGNFQILLQGAETESQVAQNAQTDSEDAAPTEDQPQEQEEEEPDFFELVNPAADENASFSKSSDAAVDEQKMKEETSNDADVKEILYDSTECSAASSESSRVDYLLKSNASSEKTSERFVPYHVGGAAAPLILPVCEPETSDAPESETREYRRARIFCPFSDEYRQDVTQDAPRELEDEFWVIEQNIGSASFWKRNGDRWSQETVKSFLEGDDSSRVTIFWAHGYQTSLQDATQDGFLLKKKLDAARSEFGIQRRYRLVVWRWNSEREYARLRVDAKEKKFFAHQCGVELGKFIGKMSPKSDVSLIGFSFGATLTGSALETLATTQNRYLGARRILQEGEVAGRVSLVLMSAACDLGAFLKGGVYSRGAALPERVLNMYNPNDGALHFYPFVSGTSQAQGVAPLTGSEFPSAYGATYNLNMNATLGKEHTFVGALSLLPSQTLAAILF
ncbi:MAG: hypothetical protein ACI4NV_05680 [Thermoguttaceae bacterium]